MGIENTLPVATPAESADHAALHCLKSLDQQWPFLLSLLPSAWEEWAKHTGAFLRPRGVPDAATLLRLIFAYAYCGLSLRSTVFWAHAGGVATLSPVALYKRLRAARVWVGRLLAWVLTQRASGRAPSGPKQPVYLMDATAVAAPGSKGADWKMHLLMDLGTLTVQQVQLTSAKEGETFKRLPLYPGMIVLGDRGYSQRQGIAQVVAQGAHVLVRLNCRNVPLEHEDGSPFDLLGALKSLPDGEVGEWEVRTAPTKGVPAVAGRLVALRKSPEAAEQARRRVRKEAQRKGKTPSAEALLAAEYLFVFTTVEKEVLSAPEALELYRFRWQIELMFKRWKSLLEVDSLPAKDPELAQTFLLTKLLAAVLIEDLAHRWVDFSPWGYGPPAAAVALAGVSKRKPDAQAVCGSGDYAPGVA